MTTSPPARFDLTTSRRLTITPQEVAALDQRLRRYATRRLSGNLALVDDLVNETWMHAYAPRAAFEGRASTETWLIAILRRRIATHFRTRYRRGEVLLADPDDHAAPRMSESRVLARFELEAVAAGLGRLNARERRLIESSLFGSRTATAEDLGMNATAYRVALHRARQKLRQARADASPRAAAPKAA